MATTETLVNMLNDSDNNISAPDVDDEVVICRKDRINVLYSEDEEDDGEDNREEEPTGSREAKSSQECGEESNFDECSDKPAEELFPNRTSMAERLADPSFVEQTTGTKLPIVSDDAISESINDIAKSVGDPTSVHSSIAEDVGCEEEAVKIQKKMSRILDSDSENETFDSLLVDEKQKLLRSTSPGSIRAIERNDEETAKPNGKRLRILNSDSEEDEELLKQKKISITKSVKPNKISALIDSDSEDEDPPTCTFRGSSDEEKTMTHDRSPLTAKNKQPEKKKRSKSIRAAKEEAMREIHSESQRMLRESQVSLPYHRPRQRTLQEFLNRKKGLPTLPKTLTAAAKMKMSGELVGKVLEEKEKEAELFYKSSSDSDNEGGSARQDQVSSQAVVEPKRIPVDSNTRNQTAIDETQKIERSDLKSGQAGKEAIQQGDKSLGIPRKLFTGLDNEAETTEDQPEEITSEPRDCNLKRKEFKQGLQDVSMPRKLFGSACNEPMNIEPERIDVDPEGIQKNDHVPKIHHTNDCQVAIPFESNDFLENERIYETVKLPDARKNESMEEETENFELKMSEDPYETTNHKIVHHETADPKPIAIEFDAITETPFIDHREVSKLNARKNESAGVIIADGAENQSGDNHCNSTTNKDSLFSNSVSSCSNGDSDHGEKPFGHVYGIPLSDFDVKANKSKSGILPEIMRLTPKLQGSPDMLIELSPPKVGVNKLIQRFFNHSVAKKPPESGAEVTAIHTERTANGLKVVSEILPYRIPVNDKNDDPELSKPGAKLVRLKEELQQQMAIQRSKEWKQKESEMKTLEDENVYRDELSDCGMEDVDDVKEQDEDKDEDEDEDQDQDEDQDEDGKDSELDDDDLPIIEEEDNHRNPFVDAEAHVSESESEDREAEEDSTGDGCMGSDGGDSENDLDQGVELESTADASPQRKTQKLKRIIKRFDDEDSDNTEIKGSDAIVADSAMVPQFRRTRTDVDMFATDNNSNDDWLSGADEDLPVYQQRRDEISQSCATPSVLNNSPSIVSPITQLTALNTGIVSVNTESQSGQNSLQFVAPLSVETTPIEAKCYRECNPEKRDRLQKKLFDDVKDTSNDTDPMGLCFGQFSENTSANSELTKLMHSARKTSVSDAELLDLCSGTFASQPAETDKLEACGATGSSLPSTDGSAKRVQQKSDTISAMLRIVSSSDEENDTHISHAANARKKKFKKRVSKLQLSDEEDESDTEKDLSDVEERKNSEDEFVDYDSEENEIVVPRKDVRKAAAGFLDEEAELSESEWGSADEDEKGLDELDLEEGDLDDIDQDQVRKQLEKIHMRQVLDADQREVRLLQEILLEDGELHSDSASRQRKFKWRNIDEVEKDSQGQLPDVDEEAVFADPNEAESDLEWQKQRFEREKFLQEQRLKEGTENDGEEEGDSQLFQLGMRALKKKSNKNKLPDKDLSRAVVAEKSEISVTRHTVADLFASPGCGKKTFALQRAIHRGSFLARGEESLARLSVITRQNSGQTVIRPKNSRNFVFAQLTPTIEGAAAEDETALVGQKNSTSDSKFRKRKPPSSLTPTSSKKFKRE